MVGRYSVPGTRFEEEGVVWAATKPRRSWGVAVRSSGAEDSARRRGQGAAAIMAALSVERASEGKATGRPRRLASAVKRRRSSELAATPPETTRPRAPKASAALKVWRRRLPTTAYWKEAIRSRVWESSRLRASAGFRLGLAAMMWRRASMASCMAWVWVERREGGFMAL